MPIYLSHSPQETQALGESWGRDSQSGLVFGLSGELGAGKTQLVKGLAKGLGIPSPVHSPSFALVNVYSDGRLPLFHLDLYRLDSVEQIRAAGLEEYLQPEGVTVIEWIERWFPESPKSKVQSPKSNFEGPMPELQERLHSKAAEASSDVGLWTSGFGLLFRRVRIETLSETERRIIYEAPGH